MSKWIDAEWLMNFFVDIPDNFTLTIGNLRATVNDAPSIDIVRCSECKYWRNTESEKIPTASIACGNMHPDDFCSYGQKERSSDEGMQ
jgi:hypothetical protein